MKLTVQLVPHADDDTETVVREVFTLQRKDHPSTDRAPEDCGGNGCQAAQVHRFTVHGRDYGCGEQW